MKQLKVVVKHLINPEISKLLNKVIQKSQSVNTCKDLWQEIQHIDIFFDDTYDLGDSCGVLATYSVDEDIIDFHDGDGTLLFYICN